MNSKQRPVWDYFVPLPRNWVLLFGVGCAAFGMYKAIVVESPTLAQKLTFAGITELGFAFIIAHIIIAIVDERHKVAFYASVDEEKNQLKKSLKIAERRLALNGFLSHAVGMELPKAFSEEISAYLVTSRLIKRNQNITYWLKPAGQYVHFVQAIEAEFENATEEVQPFSGHFESYDSVKPNLENKLSGIFFGVLSAEILIKDKKSHIFTPSEQELKISRYEVKPAKEIKLQPGDRVKFKVKISVAKHAEDLELFTNKTFAENFEHEVIYDPAFFKVNYRAVHARPECMKIMKTKEGEKLYFDSPFLPSNGTVVWWEKLQ